MQGPRNKRQQIGGGAHFDIQRDLICTTDRRGYFVSLNSAWENVLGWTRGQLMARPFIEFVHPADQPRTLEQAGRISEPDAELIDFENRYRTASGDYRWLRWSARTDGELWFAVAYDVTAEKEAESWVRRSLSAGSLVPFAQPVLDQRTGRVLQEELLVRVADQNGVYSLPPSFIPAAERNGLITHIDYRMARQGLRLAQRGRHAAVNISARSMGDPAFGKAIVELMRSAPHGAERMTFELTETAVMENMDAARDFGDKLHGLGCRLALDDFGTGFASLTYLRHLPIDYLKVDASFVRGATSEERARQLIRGIVAIAEQCKMTTIAEGVEDKPTFNMLRECGVDRMQGYLVGRPRALTDSPFWRTEARGPLLTPAPRSTAPPAVPPPRELLTAAAV